MAHLIENLIGTMLNQVPQPTDRPATAFHYSSTCPAAPGHPNGGPPGNAHAAARIQWAVHHAQVPPPGPALTALPITSAAGLRSPHEAGLRPGSWPQSPAVLVRPTGAALPTTRLQPPPWRRGGAAPAALPPTGHLARGPTEGEPRCLAHPAAAARRDRGRTQSVAGTAHFLYAGKHNALSLHSLGMSASSAAPHGPSGSKPRPEFSSGARPGPSPPRQLIACTCRSQLRPSLRTASS
jgi:hypothetical protein